MRLLRALAAYLSLTVFASAQILTPQFPPGVFDNAAATSGAAPVSGAPVMVVPLVGGASTMNSGTIFYSAINQNVNSGINTTLSLRQVPWPVAGIISNMRFDIGATLTGAGTYTVGLNTGTAGTISALQCQVSLANFCTTVHGAPQASGSWTTASTTITLSAACSTFPNLATNDYIYDSTLGAPIGTMASCSGSTLTLNAVALHNSKSAADNLTASLSIAVTAGELLAWEANPASTPSNTGINSFSAIFVPTDNISMPIVANVGLGTTPVGNISAYAITATTIGAATITSGTPFGDYGVSIVVPEAGSLTTIYAQALGGASSNNGWYVTPYVNGVSQAALSANLTGTQANGTGSVAVAAGNTLSAQFCPAGVTGCTAGTPPATARATAVGLAFVPTTGHQPFIAASGLTIGTTATHYLMANGLIVNNTSEGAAYYVVPVPMAFNSFLVSGCYSTANSGSRTFNAVAETGFTATGPNVVAGQTPISAWNPSTVAGVGPPNTNYGCAAAPPTLFDLITTGNWNLTAAAGSVVTLQSVPTGTPDTLLTVKNSSLLTMQGP